MLDVESSMSDVTVSTYDVQALCGLFNPASGLPQPLCVMLLGKKGKEDRERRHGTKTKKKEKGIRKDKDGEKVREKSLTGYRNIFPVKI